jgi:hypothetical protein
MRPVSYSDRRDEPHAINQFVPTEAAMVDDLVVTFEDPVGEPVVAHELPDVSTGLSSGDLDGKGTRVIFSDTCSLVQIRQPA